MVENILITPASVCKAKKQVYRHLLGITILCCVCLFTKILNAQNFQEDFKKLQETYQQLDNFYCEINIKMYESATAYKPGEIMHSAIKKHKDEFYYSMGAMKMLVNGTCILYINDSEKQIVYTIRDTKREIKIPGSNALTLIDSLIKRSDSVVFVQSNDSNNKCYTIYDLKGLITKTVFAIDNHNGLIKSIEYYYDPKRTSSSEKIVIEYVNMNTRATFGNSEFSEKKFIEHSGNSLKPYPPYTNYSLAVIDEHELK